jgi:hypothetical protein
MVKIQSCNEELSHAGHHNGGHHQAEHNHREAQRRGEPAPPHPHDAARHALLLRISTLGIAIAQEVLPCAVRQRAEPRTEHLLAGLRHRDEPAANEPAPWAGEEAREEQEPANIRARDGRAQRCREWARAEECGRQARAVAERPAPETPTAVEERRRCRHAARGRLRSELCVCGGFAKAVEVEHAWASAFSLGEVPRRTRGQRRARNRGGHLWSAYTREG